MKDYFRHLHLKIWDHAFEESPNECCGIIKNDEYFPCKNIADDKRNSFRISPEVIGRVYASDHFGAVIHSHVDYPHISKDDMLRQNFMKVPWGVAFINDYIKDGIHFWGDGIDQDLEERPFIHGLYDCYSLVSDYYKVKFEKPLPFVPRENLWYEKGGNLFEKNFAEAGFEEVPEFGYQPVVGDIYLFKIRCPVYNHCAVYIGSELILHHLYNRLSTYTSMYPWVHRAAKDGLLLRKKLNA